MRPLLITIVLLAFAGGAGDCLAQTDGRSSAPAPDAADQAGTSDNNPAVRSGASAARRERMRKFSSAAQFFEGNAREVAREFVVQPVLRFDDNARANNDGTVWVWGRNGRPVAVAEIFSNTGQESLTHTGHSLSTGRLVGHLNGGQVLVAGKAGIVLQPLEDGPPPATSELGRLRQFKQLSRRFTAHEYWRPGSTRYELRPLPQPLYRYRDQATGIVDGVLFAFCHGTNPEVIMLMELVQEADLTTWQFAFARLAHADCHVELDGTEVWRCVRYEDTVPAGEPYWTFSRTFAQVDRPAATVAPKGRLRSLFDSFFGGNP